ncbi:MAG TPA: HAD family hydrolase [Ohtaekwangia sp.]|uniref:HAD family hydrolase n=1 Tax=Ohtaekwangia sp. TaxID=2066019 RepID=UPI002F920A03
MSNKRGLALFDFDGTITTRDTLFEFIHFAKGSFQFFTGFLVLSPMLALFKAGFISNANAKQYVLSYFFKGIDVSAFNRLCGEFAQQRIPQLIRLKALEEIRQHLASGYKVVIVSASPENWVKPWADSLPVECIATRMEVVDGKITGRFQGMNCHGEEKVERIRAYLNTDEFTPIYTYGDTSGDRPMLALGQHAHYKPFRK